MMGQFRPDKSWADVCDALGFVEIEPFCDIMARYAPPSSCLSHLWLLDESSKNFTQFALVFSPDEEKSQDQHALAEWLWNHLQP